MNIKKNSYYLLLVLLIVSSGIEMFGQDTYADTFSSSSYTQNNGNQNFAAGWDETNDDNSPNNGRIRVNSNQLRFRNLDNRSITRDLDLSGETNVVLTFSYNAFGRGGEDLDVNLWNDNTGAYELIQRINTNDAGNISHVLTADQISANSSIQFISKASDTNWGGGDQIFIDNVLFQTNVFIINNGTISTCDAGFQDSGGLFGEYDNNELFTYTICPDVSGAMIEADFTSFAVEAPSGGGTIWDFLEIYDGNTTAGTLIGTYYNTNGSNEPGTVTATNPTGCLTFVFDSDNSVTEAGWEATITCVMFRWMKMQEL